MKKLLLLLALLLPVSISAQTSGVAYRFRGGTAAPPATCRATNPIDIYYRSTTDILYVCSSTNTWTILAAASSGGPGNVVGPASAVDSHLAVFDGTTGKLIKDGGAIPSATPAGSDTQVQFNDSSAFGGDAGLVYNKTTDTLTVGTLGGVLASTVTGTTQSQADNSTKVATTAYVDTGLGGKQATITFGTGVQTALGVNVGSAGAPVINGGALGSPSSAGTLPAFTLGGTVSGGGNQLNNVIIGTTIPLAGTFTTGVFGSTTSLLLGTAGSAVGNIGFRNATSGTATLAPPTGALGTYNVTLPNAASTLPIFGQQITFAGPTAPRTITVPDAPFTVARTDAANTFTGVQTMTSPVLTTPDLGTPSAVTLTNATGLPVAGLSNLGTNVGTFLITPTSANFFAAITDESGTGAVLGQTSATISTPRISQIFGGTAAGSNLNLISTTGTGTTDAIVFKTGTNGGTTAATVNHDGTVTLNAITSDATHTDATVCIDTTSKTLYQGSGTVGICLGTSSARFKNRIRPLTVHALEDIMALRPISFFYKKGYGDDGARGQNGFAAEDVVKPLPELVGLDAKGLPNSVDILGMVPRVIIPGMQELNAKFDAMALRLTTLEKENRRLRVQLRHKRR